MEPQSQGLMFYVRHLQLDWLAGEGIFANVVPMVQIKNIKSICDKDIEIVANTIRGNSKTKLACLNIKEKIIASSVVLDSRCESSSPKCDEVP